MVCFYGVFEGSFEVFLRVVLRVVLGWFKCRKKVIDTHKDTPPTETTLIISLFGAIKVRLKRYKVRRNAIYS